MSTKVHTAARPKTPTPPALPESIDAVDAAMDDAVARLGELFDTPCYPLLTDAVMDYVTVNRVYDDLRARYGERGEKLTVVVHNGGGDINQAFVLGGLFRRYGSTELNFVVPRWAKSAATLLVTAGDKILMAPPAELGPLDPQIHTHADAEHVEEFSPLHLAAALSLIRDEYANGHAIFAAGLLAKLQFPLTLGSYTESLRIGEVYLERLLSTRMLKDSPVEKIKEIAERFSRGFADHAYSILCDECQAIGLNVEELSGERLDTAWQLVRLYHRRDELEKIAQRRAMAERLRKMSPEDRAKLGLEGLPFELLDEMESPPIVPSTTNGTRV